VSEGAYLVLQTHPRTYGDFEIEYAVLDSVGTLLGRGRMRVQVTAAEPLLRDPRLALVEDSGPVTLLYDQLRVAHTDAEGGYWEAEGSFGVDVVVANDGLVLTPAADWSGSAQVPVRLYEADGSLADEIALELTVSAINDAPDVTGGSYSMVVGGFIEIELSELVSDSDDSLADLAIDVVGDEFVTAEIVGGKLRLRGTQAEGPGRVALTAIDPHGVLTRAHLEVSVTTLSQAPQVEAPALSLYPGQALRVDLSQWIDDADSGADDLTITAIA
ncbi:uncharacterized protein METZ01_LOCUS418923, partial [marine metagenome]